VTELFSREEAQKAQKGKPDMNRTFLASRCPGDIRVRVSSSGVLRLGTAALLQT